MRACCTDNAGTWNKAALPDITGSIVLDSTIARAQMFGEPVITSGVFSQDTVSKYASEDALSQASSMCRALYFNASNSNSVYGSSNTVLPESINQAIIIYLGR